ncbi:retrovirus-related pol polyprotein from transposon TNT 1-94 [Tanacetum coccineum]
MSDEVDQNVVDKQCAKIVKKNLLIENENLIANCLSNQLLFDVEKSRCLDLEAEMSKVHNGVKTYSKLKGNTLFAIKKCELYNATMSMISTPTVKRILNKRKHIWKPKGKLTDNRLNTTGKKFVLGEMCPLTKLSVKCHPLVSGLRLFKTYDGESFKAQEFCGKVHRVKYTKSWLWHRRLNHLNFGTINDLARKDLVRGLPRLKFEKDHLCLACQLGKSKFSHKLKSENTNMEVLHALHMDLCGPMRVQSINGKKYILVIVDDYSRFTWVKFLRSKDETPEFVINFLKQIQVGLNKIVRYIRTDNGTEVVNQVMSKYYEGVGIFHQKSVPRTPQQNGVVER